MNQITLKIESNAKDVLNQMLAERNGLGFTTISRCIDYVCREMKLINLIPDDGLKIKLITLLIEDRKIKIERDMTNLPQDMKDHLKNMLDTLGKIHQRQIRPTYVIFNPEDLKMPEVTKHSSQWITLNAANKWRKRLSNRDSKDYVVDTLLNYKKLQYQKQ